MKVCDLTQSYAPTGGGVRTYIHAKRDFIESDTCDEHLLIVPGEADSRVRQGRATVCTVRSPRLPGSSAYRLLVRSDKVLSILRAERPDLIEVHCCYNLPWTALHHQRTAPGVPVVGVSMTDLPRAYVEPVARRMLGARVGSRMARLAQRYVATLYGRMDAVVAISPALGDQLRSMGVANVHHVPLGVDLGTFHPGRRDAALRARWGLSPEDTLLVYAGRMDYEKRPDLVLDAFARLPRNGRYALALVGDGPLADSLRARAARAGRVRVLPFVSDREELATLLASADLYVTAMPYETFGLSVVEAQASGLAVVGVAGGAMTERVPDGSGVGWLGAVDSVEELALNIQRAVEGGELRSAGARGRRLVEASFCWRRTFERLFELYRTLRSADPDARLAA